MKYLFSNTFFIVLFTLPAVFAQENKWELKKDEDGIKVYTRGVEDSNIKEFKSSTNINASSDILYNIILDVENYPKWIEDIDYAQKLYHKDDQIGMYYRLSLPWPIKDRDLAMVSNITRNADSSILFELGGKTDLITLNNEFIRITNIHGSWLIKPLDKNRCEVNYRFLADPEGSLPAWVVNLFIVDGPFKTMQNLEQYSKAYKSTSN